MTLTVGSLFSGIGGVEIGFEKAGFRTLWFVENEPYAQTILKKRFPNAIFYGDITKLDFRTVPKVNILTGGFPCQDISNAGKRVGIEGSRSSLWTYYLEAIRILRPEYAFVENVSALLNRGLDVVLADLAEVGYDAEWYCVPASAIGANHRRDRIFIMAYSQCGYDESGIRSNFVPRVQGTEQNCESGSASERCGVKEGTDANVSDTEIYRDSGVSGAMGQKETETRQQDVGPESFSSSTDVSNTEHNGQFATAKRGSIKETGNWTEERENCSCESSGICESESCGDISGRVAKAENVSDTAIRLHNEEDEQKLERERSNEFLPIESRSNENVSNTDSEGLERKYESEYRSRESEKALRRRTDWSVEPDVGRVADGVSFRVDRIKCLGNAVVPQLAEVFAKAIKEKEKMRRK